MPAGLHVDAALRGWRCKSSVLVQVQPRVLSGGGNCLAPPCPPDRKRKESPANAEGTTWHKTGIGRAGSTPLLAGAQMANASAQSDAGRASHMFLHPLSPGLQSCSRESGNRFPVRNCAQVNIFGCSSAVERLTVNQDVAGSNPASRANTERNISGGMPVGVHRLKRTAERPLTILLSPGPEISRRMPVELHNHLVAGSNPAIAFRDVAQLDRAVENVSPTP